MAIPASYTEPGLALYMHAVLGKVAELLGYTAPGSYSEQVNDVLTALGLEDIGSATDVAGLRAVARREAWRKAKADAASLYDFKADGGDYSRSQVLAGIDKNLADAEQAAVHLGEPGHLERRVQGELLQVGQVLLCLVRAAGQRPEGHRHLLVE